MLATKEYGQAIHSTLRRATTCWIVKQAYCPEATLERHQREPFAAMNDHRQRTGVRLLKHTSAPEIADAGSYEVRFSDGRGSVYFYWDDNPGRRSITQALSSEEAERRAKELARKERAKL